MVAGPAPAGAAIAATTPRTKARSSLMGCDILATGLSRSGVICCAEATVARILLPRLLQRSPERVGEKSRRGARFRAGRGAAHRTGGRNGRRTATFAPAMRGAPRAAIDWKRPALRSRPARHQARHRRGQEALRQGHGGDECRGLPCSAQAPGREVGRLDACGAATVALDRRLAGRPAGSPRRRRERLPVARRGRRRLRALRGDLARTLNQHARDLADPDTVGFPSAVGHQRDADHAQSARWRWTDYCWWRRWESNPRPETLSRRRLRR